MKNAFSNAWRLYVKNFGAVLLYALLELTLYLIALAPALLLIAPETRVFALLSPVLFVLLILPARQNAAQCMQAALNGAPLFSLILVSFENYGKKLVSGLKVTLLMLLWSLPFIAATIVAVAAFSGGMVDAFTLLTFFSKLGGGSITGGVVVVLALYLLTLLPIVFGFAFHSGARHAHALHASPRGGRGKVIGVWFAGIVTLVPFALVAAAVLASYASALVAALSNFTSGIVLPPLDSNALIILAAFVVLCLPLLPLRELLTAACVRQVKA